MAINANPTSFKSLVTGWLDIVRVSDLSVHRVGIIIVGEYMAFTQ